MLTKTPDPNSVHLLRFCRSISNESPPVLLLIAPDEDCQPLDCFHNVRRKVARCGGSIVTGWAIWEWPGVFFEAEHHAVYDDGYGDIIDLTPSQETGYTHRVFLRDDTAIYNFENEGNRRANIRKTLRKDPAIEQFFAAAQRRDDLMDQLPGIGEISVSREMAAELNAANSEVAKRLFALAKRYLGRNDPCLCGSGEKFKKCCGSAEIPGRTPFPGRRART